MEHAEGAGVGDLRVDRGVVQPAPPSHLGRRLQPCGLRTAVHRGGQCRM